MSQGVRLTTPLLQETRLVVVATAALLLYTSLSCIPLVGAFSATPTKTSSSSSSSVTITQCRLHHHRINNNNNKQQLHLSKIIDAEVIPDDEPTSSTTQEEQYASLNLIEYSQNQDVDWKTMPIAFCDTLSNTYIDCNLAFYVKDRGGGSGDDVEYALGVPTEIPIVVALELENNGSNGGGSSSRSSTNNNQGGGVVNLSKVLPINPDDESISSSSSNDHHDDDDDNNSNILKEEEKEEIFQLAARAIMNEYGKSIRMKKTPRVLTLEGNLDDLIGDWKDVLLGSNGSSGKENNNMSIDDALDIFDEDDDDEEDFFDKVMKRDLGENYMSLLDNDDDDNTGISDEELLKLFDNSVEEDGDDDLNALLDDIETNESKFKDTTYDQLVQQLQPSAALKLLNFVGPDNKEYTILRPLRPILLIGKEDPDDYTRRILLTEEERNAILPRLERSCREGLEEAGFFLAGSGD